MGWDKGVGVIRRVGSKKGGVHYISEVLFWGCGWRLILYYIALDVLISL